MDTLQALETLRLVLRSVRCDPDRARAEGLLDEEAFLRIRKRIYRRKQVASHDIQVIREAAMTVEKWVD